MCIGSNSVNQAQDSMTVTKIKDLPNSLLPILYTLQTFQVKQSTDTTGFVL